MQRGFQEQAEVVRLTCLDERRGNGRRVIVNTCTPVLSELHDDPPVFGNDVLAGNESHAVVGHGSRSHADDIAQLNERMPPIHRVKHILTKVLEPGMVEVVEQFGLILSFVIYNLEGLGHHKALTLPDTP